HRYVPRLRSSRVTLIYGLRPLRALSNASIYTRPEFPKMKVIGALAAALGMAGRHGTLLAATSIVVGLAIPDLAAVCKPFLGEAIVVMLTLAFLRVDPADLRGHWARPELIAAATAWTMLIVPAVLGMVFLAFRLGQHMPGLYFMLVLQMSAPGLMSSPAFAALLGLDVALTLATLIISTAITPLTASFFTYIYYLSRNRRRLPACFRSQALLDHRRLCSRCNYHPARDRTGVPRSTARTHRWPERARYVNVCNCGNGRCC